jgi:phosphatidate cytidylyltransferase
MVWQGAALHLYGGVIEGYLDLMTLPIVALVFLFAGMAFAVGKESPPELFTRHSRLIWGLLYVGMLYPYVFRVGQGTANINGGDALLFLFGVLWLGDTAAMYVGSQFGKHKLAPAVSPNKTVEGFIGGIVGAIAVAVIMGFWKLTDVGWGHLIAIAVGASVFGQLGDLVESMWKRSRGIKDSSAIIPGHGGVLDRFDSLLFAAPFVYLYITWMRL